MSIFAFIGGAIGFKIQESIAGEYKSLLNMLNNANEKDRRQIIKVTQTVALRL